MNVKTYPVIAAIPNYNMAPLLDELLSKLVAMNYDAIYVLDDASTDNSRLVAEKYNVHFASLPKNSGSSAARNQILQFIHEPSIIHFLDADVDIQSDPTEAIRNHKFTENTGFVGGLLLTEKGEPYAWSYGPKISFVGDLTSVFYSLLLGKNESRSSSRLLKLFKNRPLSQPNFNQLHPNWVIESNFFILSKTFKNFGGFDSLLREHDIQPLAIKLAKAGFKNDINENVVVTRQNTLNVRNYNRLLANIKAEGYIIRKYLGFWRWLFESRN